MTVRVCAASYRAAVSSGDAASTAAFNDSRLTEAIGQLPAVMPATYAIFAPAFSQPAGVRPYGRPCQESTAWMQDAMARRAVALLRIAVRTRPDSRSLLVRQTPVACPKPAIAGFAGFDGQPHHAKAMWLRATDRRVTTGPSMTAGARRKCHMPVLQALMLMMRSCRDSPASTPEATAMRVRQEIS
jgi:hypothetical protein